ncbi:MAG TPA: tetratricopeptide repeat protein [Thermoanaerobaculia bacterium]|nr:tetratricopeptide repeat protein [Thermoanaerobaculia bacterium]
MPHPAHPPRRLLPILLLAAALLPAASCSNVRSPSEEATLWNGAREALAQGEFIRAEQLLTRLLDEHPGAPEGREALFYLGLLHLDPRNPSGDAPTAAEELLRYLNHRGEIERRVEGLALFALARQLSLPPEQLVAELVPGGMPPPVVVVAPDGAGGDPADVERLRSALASRNAEIARLREELERIRRTLAPTKPQ